MHVIENLTNEKIVRGCSMSNDKIRLNHSRLINNIKCTCACIFFKEVDFCHHKMPATRTGLNQLW